MNQSSIMTVSELTDRIRRLLELDFSSVRIEAEVGQLNHHRSGHVYLTFKDKQARIDAVIWRSSIPRLKHRPELGEKVLIHGHLSVYPPHGAYKLVVNQIELAGSGDLQKAFEVSKKKLADEGLFRAEHKKPLPSLPKSIGVITSATGAARRDIESILARRSPQIPIFLYPALVQGESAVRDLIEGLRVLDRMPEVEVIIIGRGGGSLEDLWAFNDEHLARAIFHMITPVISAVGHETDTTIADFVADVRAPTPSAAAELAAPVRDDCLFTVNELEDRLTRAVQVTIERKSAQLTNALLRIRRSVSITDKRMVIGGLLNRIERGALHLIQQKNTDLHRVQKRLANEHPGTQLERQRRLLNTLRLSLERFGTGRVQASRNNLSQAVARLEALSPLSVLGRGYSVVTYEGQLISSVAQLTEGMRANIKLKDGSATAQVVEITHSHERVD